MPPAPIPANEAQRLSALLACNVLDTPPEEGFDDLTRLARKLCDTPIALISLLDENRQWFKSRVGLDATQTPRDAAFCGYAILQQGPMVIEDARNDERTHDNPLVAGPPGIRFYAGVPLLVEGGLPLGTLCVIDTKPRKASRAMLEDLASLARQAACQLELRRTIATVREAQSRAEQANRAKSAFLAHMSHELRTPLTSILGYADLLLDKDASGQIDAAKAIDRNAHHLLEVVNDVLDISKIEAGMMQIDRADTRLPRVLADAVEIVRERAVQKGLEIITRFESPIPASITTDALRLRQVLINLLGNAIKFTEQGRVTLAVRADPAAGLISLRVSDTGIGMTPQQLRRIARFEAFQQADGSTSRRYGGTGLGLRISHTLAQLLGGSIGVESRIDHGSTFTLTLPIGADAAPCISPADFQSRYHEALHADTRPSTSTNTDAPLAGMRILLVEDSTDNQRLLALHLRRAGATVDTADNGHRAIDIIRQNSACDGILMDIEMPGMDGYEATRQLRKDGFQKPIVFLSAHATSESRAQALQAGGDEYLTKPVERDKLLATCKAWPRQATNPANPSAA